MLLMCIILFIFIVLVVVLLVVVQIVSLCGIGLVSYGLCLSVDICVQVLNKVKVNVLEVYIVEIGVVKLCLFEVCCVEFIGEIDCYVFSVVQLLDIEDKKVKIYIVIVCVEINIILLQIKLDVGLVVVGVIVVQCLLLIFLFMVCLQDIVQLFQDKEYCCVDVSSSYSENICEGDSFRGNLVSINGSINQNGLVLVISGGSIIVCVDNIIWKVVNVVEVNIVMIGVFSVVGYEVVEVEYVEGELCGLFSIECICKDFSIGNDLVLVILCDIVNGICVVNILYIVVGIFDIGMCDCDLVSGNICVFVIVIGKVLDVIGCFLCIVLLVGLVQFFGIGLNEIVVCINVLQLVVEKVVQQMINELNVKVVC